MGWSAYPMKDGAMLKCPVGMHAGCYEKALSEYVLSTRYQPDEDNEPSISLEDVQSILSEMNWNDNLSPDELHVQRFLQWCSMHGAGVWFSF